MSSANFARPAVSSAPSADPAPPTHPAFSHQEMMGHAYHNHHVPHYPPGQHQYTYLPSCGPNDAPMGPPSFDNDDDEMPAGILKKPLGKPVTKVAGRRRTIQPDPKGKGKERVVDSEPKSTKRKALPGDIEGPAAKKKRGGRVNGAPNYSEVDVDALLDIVEVRLPVGPIGWTQVGEDFGKWAKSEGRPERTAKSLENKYKQLVRTKKPTGEGTIPSEIARALEIEQLILIEAETRELDDSEIVDQDDQDVLELSTEDEEDSPPARKPNKDVKTVKQEPKTYSVGLSRRMAEREQPAPRNRTSRVNQSQDFLSSISSALDPSTQEARDDARAARSMQSTQIFTMYQTLRDSQTTTETLRTRLQESETARADALRKVDKLEIELRILTGGRRRTHSTPPRFERSSRWDRTPDRHSRFDDFNNFDTPVRHRKYSPDLRPRRRQEPERPDRRVREETFFPEGGRMVRWVGGSDDEGYPNDRPPTPEPGTITYTVNPLSPPSTIRPPSSSNIFMASVPLDSESGDV
ncbi:hypothetical protein GALMADRAFT_216203 [Galerina marginata CBS 339.88]|uniref:DUF6818 domain-containing protein n=1 Tax=Galerina marginata (strain CBS 339.88) TaxID=685588 RepID=A0A067SAE4_GALM3|nr:hypothetical protein GALMADRAFT_216203 [Galerina marginata CBS 339.88]